MIPTGQTGLIGTGVMGLTAAVKLLAAGVQVLAYDAFPGSREKARAAGAAIALSPADLAGRCSLILLFLPGPDQVAVCVDGPDGLLTTAKPGTVIVDLSTVDPTSTRTLAAAAKAKQVGYLDAPILGRPASVGNWALPVGGESAALEQARPVLEKIAGHIMPVGESGAGNKIKLLNQMMFAAINAMTAEMMAVSAKLGVPPKMLYDTITASRAGTVSNLFVELGKNIGADSYDQPTFSVDLLAKDLRLALDMAREGGAPPILARAIQTLNETAQARGLGKMDTSIMWKLYAPFWTADTPSNG